MNGLTYFTSVFCVYDTLESMFGVKDEYILCLKEIFWFGSDKEFKMYYGNNMISPN